MLKPALLCAAALALAACATVGTSALTAKEQRGKAFAEAHCAACHGIGPGETSPNPESPPFEAVVNTTGLTTDTLGKFLRDSHNFPGAMAFEIDSKKVDDLTAYMVTLKRADYHPEI